MPNNSQSDIFVNLEIILRDFLVDILRGRAKSSRWLSWLRFPALLSVSHSLWRELLIDLCYFFALVAGVTCTLPINSQGGHDQNLTFGGTN